MGIFGEILKRKIKTLVVADDGEGFWAVVADNAGISIDNHFPQKTELKKLLDFGKQQNVQNVLYLQTADVRELEVKLGTDLSEDERRSAIEYAAASSQGDHSGAQRIAYMDGMFHDFRSGILASYFDTEEILSIDALAKSMKMNFLGITNFKQLLLAQHFSDLDHHGDAFLFLLGNHGIAAIPERTKLVIRNLPFGIPEPGTESEWKERVQRRLTTIFRNKRVYLYTPANDERLSETLREISEAECVELMPWEDAVANAAMYFLKSGQQLVHPALPPPKEKDPKAPGTYVACFFVAATLLSLGFLMGRNCLTKYIFQRDIDDNQKIIDTIKAEENALKALEKDLADQQEIFSVLKQKERISRNYILVLNLLARYPLQYSRITSIQEKATGVFIEGESVWQPDLSRFFTHFEGELSNYQLSLFSDGLTKEKDGKIIFRSHVAPIGGAN